MPSLSALLVVAVAVPPLWFLITLYRLTLHPLAKYPGPFWWKISAWPDTIATKSGKRHIVHYQLHCKYGPVVRIGPNSLSYNSSRAFHDVHTNRNANVVKSGFVEYTRRIVDFANLQQIQGKEEHAQRRKIFNHAFTDNALKSVEPYLLRQVRTWTDTIGRRTTESVDGWGETWNLSHWTNLLTLDVFGELCFGKDFEATKSGDHNIVRSVMKGSMMATIISISPISFFFVPIMRTHFLLKLLSRKAYENRWALRRNVEGLVQQRRQIEADAEENNIEPRKDIFHYVLKGRDDNGQLLSFKNYVSESVLLIVAGTDTTSTALSALLYYLNCNPQILEKLQAEIRGTFATVEEICTGPKLSSLTYLRACLEEGLRITPPVPGSLMRKTLSGGYTIDGTHIPSGIDIGAPIYAIHHNESYFPDPHSFIPERWIAGSKTPKFEVTESLVTKQRSALVPFSTGPRNCLGMRLAWMEMSIVMARLIFLYDTRFDMTKQKITKEFETNDWFIAEKDGPYLQFKPRVVEKTG